MKNKQIKTKGMKTKKMKNIEKYKGRMNELKEFFE